MRVGVLFPDEASFYGKMGSEIYENYPDVRKLYEKMKICAKLDLRNSLIYENNVKEWTETEKKLAVLITQVALYQCWFDTYKTKPVVFFGNGVGVLSALVCVGTISLQKAVRMIRKDNWDLPRMAHLDGTVFMCSYRSALTDPSVLRIQRLSVDENVYQGIYLYAQHADLDSVIEIGPDKRYTVELQKRYEHNRPVFSYFDHREDRAFALENLYYRKHFNNLYAAKRMLGIGAATQNYNQGTESDEKIIAAYSALKTYVDEMIKKQSMGRDAFVSEYDFDLCVNQLNDILEGKKVPVQEIRDRILELQNEIASDLCTPFARWFS